MKVPGSAGARLGKRRERRERKARRGRGRRGIASAKGLALLLATISMMALPIPITIWRWTSKAGRVKPPDHEATLSVRLQTRANMETMTTVARGIMGRGDEEVKTKVMRNTERTQQTVNVAAKRRARVERKMRKRMGKRMKTKMRTEGVKEKEKRTRPNVNVVAKRRARAEQGKRKRKRRRGRLEGRHPLPNIGPQNMIVPSNTSSDSYRNLALLPDAQCNQYLSRRAS